MRALTLEFGCAHALIQKAQRKGMFLSRDKNELRSLNKPVPIRMKDGKCLYCETVPKTPRSLYCSPNCHAIDRRRDYIEKWYLGSVSGTTKAKGLIVQFLRDHIIRNALYKCSMCPFDLFHPITGRPIVQIDHIDGDSSNNSPSNIRVLCPNCHAMTPNFGSLNTKPGRAYRRINRQKNRELIKSPCLLIVR